MASFKPFKAGGSGSRYRVRYSYRLPGGPLRRLAKYSETASNAKFMVTQLSQLERAAKNGMATADQVEAWIARGYMANEDAEACFADWANLIALKGETGLEDTDYEVLEDDVHEWSAQMSKDGLKGKTHTSRMVYMRKIRRHFEERFPDIRLVGPNDIVDFLEYLHAKEKKSDLTVKHTYSHMRR